MQNIALPQLLKRGVKPSRVQLRKRRSGPWAGLIDAAWVGGPDFVEGTHTLSVAGTPTPVIEAPGLTFDAAGNDTRGIITPKISWTDTVDGNFSVAFRFMPGQVSTTLRAMVAFGAGGATTPLFYLRHTSTILETIYDCDTGTQQSSQWSHGGLWEVGHWYNIVMTFDWNGNALVYVDGIVRITDTITGNLSGTIGAGTGDWSALGGFNNSGTNWTQNCDGRFDSLYIFSEALSESQVQALQSDWYSPIEWRSPIPAATASVGGGVSAVIGQASEANSARAVTALIGAVATIGQASEANSARAVTASLGASAVISQASEADSARAVTASLGASAVIGQASEADSARAVTASVGASITIGQASEADSARPVTADGDATAVIGQASEADSARAVTASVGASITIGQASEADSARAVTDLTGAAATVGQASEADSARAVSALLGAAVTIGQASETDTARPVTVLADLLVTIGQASEVDTARPVSFSDGIISQYVSINVDVLTTTTIRVEALEITRVNMNVEVDTEISLRVDV